MTIIALRVQIWEFGALTRSCRTVRGRRRVRRTLCLRLGQPGWLLRPDLAVRPGPPHGSWAGRQLSAVW